MRANYQIVSGLHADASPLVIRDLGPWSRFATVTNAAEEVVAELIGNGYLRRDQRLLYYDSEGELDEIIHQDGKFVRFRTLTLEDRDAAL